MWLLCFSSGDLLDDLSVAFSAVNMLNLRPPWRPCLGATRFLSPSLLPLSLSSFQMCLALENPPVPLDLISSSNHPFCKLSPASCLLRGIYLSATYPSFRFFQTPNLLDAHPKENAAYPPHSLPSLFLFHVAVTTTSCQSKAYRSYRLLPSPSFQPLFLYLRTTTQIQATTVPLLNDWGRE